MRYLVRAKENSHVYGLTCPTLGDNCPKVLCCYSNSTLNA